MVSLPARPHEFVVYHTLQQCHQLSELKLFDLCVFSIAGRLAGLYFLGLDTDSGDLVLFTIVGTRKLKIRSFYGRVCYVRHHQRLRIDNNGSTNTAFCSVEICKVPSHSCGVPRGRGGEVRFPTPTVYVRFPAPPWCVVYAGENRT